MTDTPNVQDADIIEETPQSEDPQIPQSTVTDDANGATVMLELESMIKSHITGIDKRKTELKKQKEMLNDIFGNDSEYRELDDKVKAANKDKSARKAELSKAPNAAALVEKVKELTTEMKEMEEALSDYLREYQRLSGSNEIEGDDGEVREIIYFAKLIKKSSYQK